MKWKEKIGEGEKIYNLINDFNESLSSKKKTHFFFWIEDNRLLLLPGNGAL